MKLRNLVMSMNLQFFAGTGMEFLKDVLGDQYDAVVSAVNTYNGKPENKDKQIKLANIGTGEYVSTEKYNRTENDMNSYKTQLETAQGKLEAFKDVDVNELKNQIQTLTNDMNTQKQAYETQIADRDFNDSIGKAITAAGGKNAKAIMALLDAKTLKESKNQEADIKAAIEACQKENDYLFGANEPINNPTAPTNGTIPGSTKKLEDMSYEEYKAYRQGK